MEDYSVLMSVYCGENPEYLRQSILSMLNQTVVTKDFVIVCDGALTPELDTALEGFCNDNPRLFNIVQLPANVGIGAAANEGLKHCKNDLVAKMDADDIACPERCEKQLALFAQKPELSIVGSQMHEFDGDIKNIVSLRTVPIMHQDILKYARRRMPFNNITVMYRKSTILKAGGYSSLRRCEDYELYCRVLSHGGKAENIEEVLAFARLSPEAFKRRGSWNNLKGFIVARWEIHKSGFSSLMDFIIPTCGQLLLTALPTCLKGVFYSHFLRS